MMRADAKFVSLQTSVLKPVFIELLSCLETRRTFPLLVFLSFYHLYVAIHWNFTSQGSVKSNFWVWALITFWVADHFGFFCRVHFERNSDTRPSGRYVISYSCVGVSITKRNFNNFCTLLFRPLKWSLRFGTTAQYTVIWHLTQLAFQSEGQLWPQWRKLFLLQLPFIKNWLWFLI